MKNGSEKQIKSVTKHESKHTINNLFTSWKKISSEINWWQTLFFFSIFFSTIFSHTKQTKTGKLINDLLRVELWRVWNRNRRKSSWKNIFFYRCVNNEFNTGEKRLDSTSKNWARIFVWVEFGFWRRGISFPATNTPKIPPRLIHILDEIFYAIWKKYSWRKKREKNCRIFIF